MKRIDVESMVQNYKKLQLYSIDKIHVEESIMKDLKRDLEEYSGMPLGDTEKYSIVAKVIAYLEFGFSYEKYKKIFDIIILLCDTSREEINNLADMEAQYIKATKSNIQKVIIWRSHRANNRYMNKGDVVADILFRIRENKEGVYTYHTDCCRYELFIESEMVVLKNKIKEIIYYLL